MLLNNLPTELLEQIIAFVLPADVLSLLVSCKPLRSNLQARVHVNLRINGSNDGPGPLPRAFFSLTKLTSVRLFRSWSVLNIPSQNGLTHPMAFGPQLKRLEIRGYGAFKAVLDPTTCPFDPSSPSALPLDTYWSTHSLSDALPNLETFKLWDPSKQHFFVVLPDNLPLSLTNLSIKLAFVNDKGLTGINKIERLTNLTRLSLSTFATPLNATSLFASLPNLTRADIQDLSPATTLNNQMVKLRLPSLTQKWSESVVSSCTKLTSRIETLHELPLLQQLRLVTSLKLESDHGEDFFKSLPPALTELRVHAVLGSSPWFLCYLPQTLLRFTSAMQLKLLSGTEVKQRIAAEGKTLWLPPHLQLFAVYSSQPLQADEWLPLFPRSIITLRLEFSTQAPEATTAFDFASHFPNLTSTFALRPDYFRASPDYPVPDNITLPPLVRDIRIRTPYPHVLLDRLEKLRSSPLDAILRASGWPSQLKTLTLDDATYPSADAIKALPASLQDIHFCKRSTVYGTFHLKGGIILKRAVPDEFVAALSHLPAGLTSFYYFDSHLIEEPEPLLRCLPTSLTSLALSAVRNFDDRHALLLPPKLKHLEVPHAQNLSDMAMSLLPATLEHLELRLNRELTIEGLRTAPRSLRELTLNKNINFKKRQRTEVLTIVTERGMSLLLTTKKLVIE